MPVQVSEQELEWILWVDFHRARLAVDRYPDDPLSLGRGLNYATGAPESASDLKKPGQIKVRGEKLQREAFFMPLTLAMTHLRRPCRLCEACLKAEPERCEDGARYKYIHKDEWSEAEAENVNDLEQRIQGVFLRWEQLHYLDRRPPFLFTGSLAEEQRYLAQPGQDSWCAYLLPPGIEKARQMCESPDAPSWVRAALLDNRRSPLWCMDPKRRAMAPQWQQKEFVEEGGKIDESYRPEPGSVAVKCSRCDKWHVESEPCGGGYVRERDEAPSVLRSFLNKIRGTKRRKP